MSVLVDTSIWSLAFRRDVSENASHRQELVKLIEDFQARIFGPIRQELLSGIPDRKQFVLLRDGLYAFPDIPLGTEDYLSAAECFNECRKKGIQGSHVDFLICAVAMRHGLEIFTMDKDFHAYAKVLDLRLYRG